MCANRTADGCKPTEARRLNFDASSAPARNSGAYYQYGCDGDEFASVVETAGDVFFQSCGCDGDYFSGVIDELDVPGSEGESNQSQISVSSTST